MKCDKLKSTFMVLIFFSVSIGTQIIVLVNTCAIRLGLFPNICFHNNTKKPNKFKSKIYVKLNTWMLYICALTNNTKLYEPIMNKSALILPSIWFIGETSSVFSTGPTGNSAGCGSSKTIFVPPAPDLMPSI